MSAESTTESTIARICREAAVYETPERRAYNFGWLMWREVHGAAIGVTDDADYAQGVADAKRDDDFDVALRRAIDLFTLTGDALDHVEDMEESGVSVLLAQAHGNIMRAVMLLQQRRNQNDKRETY